MQETPSPSQVIKLLTQIVGTENVISEGESFQDYSKDMADYTASPIAVVKITSESAVQKVVKFANEKKTPIVARGAGSSLTGASVTNGSIVLDMRGFNRLIKVDTVNYYARVQSGITLDDLNRELKKSGFFFPPDPASSYICTVGGAIAEGSGGMRCVRYGTMKDWVIALRVVVANGTAVNLGEPLAKNRAGYDLVHLMVGSEGTLGIVTEAYLKIIPIPSSQMRRMLVLFRDWESAGRAITEVRKSNLIPSMMEFMDSTTVAAVNKALELKLPEAEATLLVDIEEERVEEITRIFRTSGSERILVAKDEEEADVFHQARAWAYVAQKALSTGTQVEDVVVPIDRLVEYLSLVKELAAKYGLRIPVVGHAGDGNVHPIILYDKENAESRDKATKVFEEICSYAISVGGSVTGEHGVGVQKTKQFREQLVSHDGAEALRLMKGIKLLFDPNGIMNPGKYVDAA
jgi:glycolate oxidase subunit GlcD